MLTTLALVAILASQPSDDVAPTVMLRGNRLCDADQGAERLTVRGTLRVIHHPAATIDGVAFEAFTEVRVESDPGGAWRRSPGCATHDADGRRVHRRAVRHTILWNNRGPTLPPERGRGSITPTRPAAGVKAVPIDPQFP